MGYGVWGSCKGRRGRKSPRFFSSWLRVRTAFISVHPVSSLFLLSSLCLRALRAGSFPKAPLPPSPRPLRLRSELPPSLPPLSVEIVKLGYGVWGSGYRARVGGNDQRSPGGDRRNGGVSDRECGVPKFLGLEAPHRGNAASRLMPGSLRPFVVGAPFQPPFPPGHRTRSLSVQTPSSD